MVRGIFHEAKRFDIVTQPEPLAEPAFLGERTLQTICLDSHCVRQAFAGAMVRALHLERSAGACLQVQPFFAFLEAFRNANFRVWRLGFRSFVLA